MSNRALYVEGNAGAAGDMILAALHDLGFSLKDIQQSLKALNVGLEVKIKKVQRQGMHALLIQPILPAKPKKQLTLSDFFQIIKKSKLSKIVKERSAEIFQRLGNTESRVHQKPVAQLHFHELGGWDTLFDIVGVVAAITALEISEIFVGPLNLGSGSVSTAHGKLPVPVPAVVELTKGFVVYSSGAKHELLTPTGAAILTTLGKPVFQMPPMTLESVGHGAGQHDFSFPNVLRLFIGDTSQARLPAWLRHPQNQVVKLETNIDDMNPQYWEHVFEELYAAGALEVFLSPTLMKKGRPAQVLTVLAPIECEEALTMVIFKETTTLGIRKELISRTLLDRKTIQVTTPFGKIPCKVGYLDGTTFNIHPEYDALKRIAQENKIPLKKLHDTVLATLASVM